ncbi:MAG: UDP-N-acetylmuramoyl-L-alanine--D-glutamate ligase [Firmicutes bacterium]|nr:UDP-N-acetylmuramoyl-L-alanine--D-glutamate ligase [Bacillota bacterium]
MASVPRPGRPPDPEEWRGRRVAVVGLGISNLALVRFLRRHGAAVEVRDQQSPEALGGRLREAMEWGAAARVGEGYLEGLDAFDAVFLTPGMRKDLPEIAALHAKGVPVSSEVGLFMRYCRAPIVGVTGSAGKTTTTTLTGRLFAAAHPRTYVGGNIGRPLVELVEDIPPDAWVVLELSSFQLELVESSPNLAAVLNLRPNHLDVHPSMDAYRAAKQRIYRFQGPGDWCVFNADDDATWPWHAEAPGRVAAFSTAQPVECGTWLAGPRAEAVVLTNLLPVRAAAEGAPLPGGTRELLRAADIRLPGAHNRANVLAAVSLAVLGGVPDAAVAPVVREFHGVPHRLETVAEVGGVLFVNDSIATSPDRSIAALETFERPVVLIAGGYDKGLDFREWAEVVRRRARAVVLVGKAAGKLAEALEAAAGRAAGGTAVGGAAAAGEGAGAAQAASGGAGGGPFVERAATFEEAVWRAAAAARPGDIVLLSPACASYDMFRNFEERGAAFREIVRRWAARAAGAADATGRA